jgi:hypothetical protein
VYVLCTDVFCDMSRLSMFPISVCEIFLTDIEIMSMYVLKYSQGQQAVVSLINRLMYRVF